MKADVLISSKLKLNCPGEQKVLNICINKTTCIIHTHTYTFICIFVALLVRLHHLHI